jgi:SsrA-binding protein
MKPIHNSRARFDYEILRTFEAGISLAGHEVKSVRNGKIKLDHGYAIVRGGEVFLVGVTIQPYQPKNTGAHYEPDRARKLLLTKKEIASLFDESEKRGLTIVPLMVYNKGRNVKVELALARGKKQYDKREKIKERETSRTIERTIKRSIGS